jgi:hypothetical protein
MLGSDFDKSDQPVIDLALRLVRARKRLGQDIDGLVETL